MKWHKLSYERGSAATEGPRNPINNDNSSSWRQYTWGDDIEITVAAPQKEEDEVNYKADTTIGSPKSFSACDWLKEHLKNNILLVS
jgi:hypothetical protein